MSEYRSEIFEVIEKYCEQSFEYDPISATIAGRSEYNAIWNDYTYHPVDPFLKVVKTTRNKLNKLKPIDYYDEVAKNVMLDDLNRYINDTDLLHHYSYFGSSYNELESMFGVFSFMPKETKEDILDIVKRLEGIPKAVTEWISAIKDVAALGSVNAKNRVEWTIESIESYTDGSFKRIAESVDPENERLALAAAHAEIAFEQAASWLKHKYLPICKDNFAVGEELYVRLAESYTGTKINPKEIYEWGLSEVERINNEMWKVSKKIKPNAQSLTEVADYLNNHPDYIIYGKENLKKKLEEITNNAINDLNKVYFNIPAKIKNCKVKLDDETIDESPYYWAPSDNLKRPGFTIYPTLGRDKFTIWENYSTWYHESVPGHHMQIATSILNKDTLTPYQRGEAWNSGYGEGWALYSETLMDELGYYKDPGHKMGYLLCQAMRAARLVVDIGLHLQYKDPEGNVWNEESAIKYMMNKALLTESYATSEIRRYISWAGQAISYKIGEKVWMDARRDAKKRLKDKFDIKKFHMYALNLGPMGLDRLKDELSKWNGK